MALFNEEYLVAGKEVVVGIDHKYNDNDGPYSEAHIWDGEEVRVDKYATGYTSLPFDAAEVDATEEQIEAAAQWWVDNGMETSLYYGCEVILQRSRKAPNKTPLIVVDYDEGGYNHYYNRAEPERIAVEVAGDIVWVSVGCIKEIRKGRRPFWAKKEEV